MKKRRFRFSKAPLERLLAHDKELPGTTERTDQAPPPPENDAAAEAAENQPVLASAALTDIGLVRANNQDTPLNASPVFGVCDGMGGHRGGEIASALAAEVLLAALQPQSPSSAALSEAVTAANRAVFDKAQADEELSGMGTTLTVVWMSPEEAYIAHVGDSRCYLLRGGELRQLTDDHSIVMEMVRAGIITPEQAEGHPMRNIITRAVGTDETVEADLLSERRAPDDVWLICSDGLHGMVSEDFIRETLSAEGRSPEKAARILLDAALAAGGRDNVSVVVVYDGEGCA
ncbi:MAG: Stp1/IreP family PP2C-type Ser/Thr phosphatase [Clostridia bacterium]|nr:Stp1/IreP family PP2C-type Ser/Thr phosphatase [Clostridia bacterium]